MKKTYQNPLIELLLNLNQDILTESLSGLDDGVKAPSEWFANEIIRE